MEGPTSTESDPSSSSLSETIFPSQSQSLWAGAHLLHPWSPGPFPGMKVGWDCTQIQRGGRSRSGEQQGQRGKGMVTEQAECGPLQKVRQAWRLPRETNLSLPRICRDEARQFRANGLISHFTCVKLSESHRLVKWWA